MSFKNFSIVLSITLLLVACSSNTAESSTGFELKGKLGNAHGETIYLEKMSPEGVSAVDTVTLDENGEFKMSPSISEIGFYRLKVSDKNFATFIFDANQKVKV